MSHKNWGRIKNEAKDLDEKNGDCSRQRKNVCMCVRERETDRQKGKREHLYFSF
jgi:hypothetical protein